MLGVQVYSLKQEIEVHHIIYKHGTLTSVEFSASILAQGGKFFGIFFFVV